MASSGKFSTLVGKLGTDLKKAFDDMKSYIKEHKVIHVVSGVLLAAVLAVTIWLSVDCAQKNKSNTELTESVAVSQSENSLFKDALYSSSYNAGVKAFEEGLDSSALDAAAEVYVSGLNWTDRNAIALDEELFNCFKNGYNETKQKQSSDNQTGTGKIEKPGDKPETNTEMVSENTESDDGRIDTVLSNGLNVYDDESVLIGTITNNSIIVYQDDGSQFVVERNGETGEIDYSTVQLVSSTGASDEIKITGTPAGESVKAKIESILKMSEAENSVINGKDGVKEPPVEPESSEK